MSANQVFKSSPANINGLFSTRLLAEILNYKPQTIRKWLHQDKLPEGLPRPFKINGRNFWCREDVDKYIYTLRHSNL
ncbi:helix-turn-helix domain-containing protein [Aeromonas jandaei]